MMKIGTVGELKDFIKDLPDDTPVVAFRYGVLTGGYQTNVGIRAENMISEKHETYDALGRPSYTYEVFSPTHDDTGTFCLLIG